MIFQPDAIQLIRQRRRGELRVPVKRHPEFGFEQPCRFKVGEVYRAQTTRRWTVGSLRAHRQLCEVEQPNRARAVLAYLDAPMEAHHPTAAVISLGFEVTVIDVRRDEAAWVIRFEVGDQRHKFDRDQFMAASIGPNPRFGENEQDYTDIAAFALDPAAPMVPHSALERFAAEGYAGHARRHEREIAQRHRRSLTNRLGDALRRGDPDAIRQIGNELERIERDLRRAA